MLTLRNGARSLQPSLYSLTRTLHVASTTTIPRRFLPSRLEGIEDVEDYQLGGFHPVSIGDCFAQKRYRVVRKLGYGEAPRSSYKGFPVKIPLNRSEKC